MNQEIVEALREFFPEAPTVDELLGEVDYVTALLEQVKEDELSDAGLLLTLTGRLFQVSERLREALGKDRVIRSVRLDEDVVERVARFAQEWELDGDSLRDSVINDLLRMTLARIENRESGFKATIGTGDARRTVEIIPPWLEKARSAAEAYSSTEDGEK